MRTLHVVFRALTVVIPGAVKNIILRAEVLLRNTKRKSNTAILQCLTLYWWPPRQDSNL